jgi:Lipid A 3-O-deacylase (PagL)
VPEPLQDNPTRLPTSTELRARLFATGTVLAVCLGTVAPSMALDSQAPTAAASTRGFSLLSPQEASVRFSYGIGDRDSLRFYSLTPRVAYDLLPSLIPAIAGNRLRLALEIGGSFIHGDHHPHDGDFTLSPLLFDWRLDLGGMLVPFFDAGEGLVLTSLKNVHIGGPFEFSSQFGGGLHFFFTTEDAVTLAVRYRHISNAGIKAENSGLNTFFVIVGLSHFGDRR